LQKLTSTLRFKNSGLIAAFFCLFAAEGAAADTDPRELVTRLQAQADAEKLYDDPTWRSLLHTSGGRPCIRDPSFLLSFPAFSPRLELFATIEQLYGGDGSAACRFPARYVWLRSRLDAPRINLGGCEELTEFLTKAPMQQIALVFASDNLSHPASMMGHSFLKFTGRAPDGREVSHAISFYTEIDTINYPKVFFNSLVVGLPGVFALAPYEEKLSDYVDVEQRTVWEYSLRIDDFHKTLIQYHLLELKHARFTYFFHSYNCATVINFILSLADERIRQHVLWTTPRDVIKNAEDAGLIQATVIITPPRWLVRSLGSAVSVREMRRIESAVASESLEGVIVRESDDRDYLRLEAARAINDYLYRAGRITRQGWAENSAFLNGTKSRFFADKALTTTEHDDPLQAPGESQIAVSAIRETGQYYLGLTFLPISHTLTDDNRQFFGENQLLLFRTSVKLRPDSGALKLDRLDIYSIESLVPYDPITGGLSGRFAIAVEPQWDGRLQRHTAFSLSGALGLTGRPAPDLDFFGLLGAGAASGYGRVYAYPSVEAGTVIREVADMKTVFSVSRTFNQITNGTNFYDFDLHQSLYLNRRLTCELRADLLHNRSDSVRSFWLSLKLNFLVRIIESSVRSLLRGKPHDCPIDGRDTGRAARERPDCRATRCAPRPGRSTDPSDSPRAGTAFRSAGTEQSCRCLRGSAAGEQGSARQWMPRANKYRRQSAMGATAAATSARCPPTSRG